MEMNRMVGLLVILAFTRATNEPGPDRHRSQCFFATPRRIERMRIAVVALAACSAGGTPLANRVPEPDEVHVVVAPALGFSGEIDEPIGWRLERTGAHATLTITKRDHRELHYVGSVVARGETRRYDLARGAERVSLDCQRLAVQVHALGSRPLARPEPVRCEEP